MIFSIIIIIIANSRHISKILRKQSFVSNNKWCKLSKYQQLSVIIFTVLIAGAKTRASELNAGAVMNKMNADERFGYISGVIEGLAYSRWLRDKPDSTGMSCIYNWYYEGGTELPR